MFKFTFIINSPDKPMGEVKPYGNEAAFIDHITLQIKQVAELKGIYSVNKQSSLFTPQFWFSTENELKHWWCHPLMWQNSIVLTIS